ncbi:four helix bundle protein [Roseivirga pacifica]|uniref:four helix bundle protein n=1 Tax=Roseivirga pacifica TaxID=1267423 RepID=UPI003BAF26AF
MGTVKRFEDLRCWQMARVLTAKAYTMSRQGELSKDYDTRSQFRSAALSVMNNIAEGFGRYSNRDFIRFLDYAAGSCTEVKSMTYLLHDLRYFPEEVIIEFQNEIEEVKASVLALVKYLRNKENAG